MFGTEKNEMTHSLTLYPTPPGSSPYKTVFVFPISLPLAILGIIASSMHLFEKCRGRGSVVGAVITIKVLSAVVATMSLVRVACPKS